MTEVKFIDATISIGDKVWDSHRETVLECPDKDNAEFFNMSLHRYKKELEAKGYTPAQVAELLEIFDRYATITFNCARQQTSWCGMGGWKSAPTYEDFTEIK